jgi:hypothetical protein
VHSSSGTALKAGAPKAVTEIPAIKYYAVPNALPWLLRWIPVAGCEREAPLDVLLSVIPGGLCLVSVFAARFAVLLLS